ncbi:beta-N-acetylhexosaminidase [Consotaella aegiceratis]|uniref:beta-N-acetylhexosaminidase n=1 Tax=Consotaella aegiceratis TaxID=3097961 RepID=UPI002F3E465C
MTAVNCRLEAEWQPLSGSNGQLEFALVNLGEAPLSGFRLVYTSLTRATQPDAVTGATLLRRCANFHEMAPPDGLTLAPGEAWRFVVGGLNRGAKHRTDGVSTAYLTLADGTAVDVAAGDLLLKGAIATAPGPLVPTGDLDLPTAILPWPRELRFGDFAAAPTALYPGDGTSRAALTAMGEVGALAQRLFPGERVPFTLVRVEGGLPVRFDTDAAMGTEAYALAFAGEGVTVTSGAPAGLHYALVTLAQMLGAAHRDPDRFSFPRDGHIDDAPRYGWRGCHLDVSRQVYPLEAVKRFVDILAWNKMNLFHWHLTDDEGWRLEIEAYPELTTIGARRGPKEAMVQQLGGGAETSAGHYTQDEVRALVASAKRLNIDIMPEFDVPGHCTAVLAALPQLIDPAETPASYHSVQGYPNNALNPALEDTYAFLETVFSEVASLFPFAYVHIGGDEVADGSWLASPRAQALMKDKGLSGTAELQAHFMRRTKEILARLDKKLAGWDEVSHGGGVDPQGTLLVAWQRPELGLALAKEGYDVVMSPGQAYYLDMVQADDWLEPGTSWAGTVPPEHTYTYEAVADFPPELADRMKGVQGCIWSENLTSRERFNHMVFPRLGAIAEAAWTPKDKKSWLRFAAIQAMMPTL